LSMLPSSTPHYHQPIHVPCWGTDFYGSHINTDHNPPGGH
jgi:hypothetical protein